MVGLIYGLIVTTVLSITGLITASTREEFMLALLFIPLPIYFFMRVIQAQFRKAQLKRLEITQNVRIQPKQDQKTTNSDSDTDGAIEGEVVNDPSIRDIDKRLFLKLIGSGGITLFMMSIFTKKSHAAFFGSVPGPGTVAIKDSSGNQIDPAEKQPTDGYEISELNEDDATYSYYGFVHKDGAWYIAREEKSTGSYRYAKGASNFSTGWTGRAGLGYDYFDNTF